MVRMLAGLCHRLVPMHDVYVMTWAQSMDVHMTSVNILRQLSRAIDSIRKPSARSPTISRETTFMVSGAEDPREAIENRAT